MTGDSILIENVLAKWATETTTTLTTFNCRSPNKIFMR